MKILCISDHIDPIIYTPSIKKRLSDVNLVISAGDLPLEYYGFIVSLLNTPCFFVFGNHHLKRYDIYRKNKIKGPDLWEENIRYKHSFGASYIGGKTARHKDLLIAGLDGSPVYNHGKNQYSELRMFAQILKLIPKFIFNKIFRGRYLDILLTHTPPYDINDQPDKCHRGFKVFLWFMRVFKPKYLLHGHVHLFNSNEKRTAVYKKTKIINIYDHYLLDVDIENIQGRDKKNE